MKKILITLLSLYSYSLFGQFVEISTIPKYGCPNTTHSVIVAAKNITPLSIPPGTVISVSVSVNTTPVTTYSESFSTGLGAGATYYVTVPNIPFGAAMTHAITGNVTFTYITPTPQTHSFTSNYIVQYPSNLSITETPTGTVEIANALDGYSARYYLNGSTTHIQQSSATTYTPSTSGDYTAKAYDIATGCTSVAASNSVTITATKTAQTITFPALTNVLVNQPNYSPGATSDNSLPITYTSSNTSVATIVAGLIHVVGSGTTIITAHQAGDGTYADAISVDRSLTVDKLTQTITFDALPSKTVSDADFVPGATSTNNTIPIFYTSSNTSVATIVSGKIHIVGAGTSTITAYQASNVVYSAATPVAQTLTVDKLTQTITFNALTAKTVGDADFAPGATSTSAVTITYTSSNLSVATIVSGQIHIVGAGTATITASQAGNATYNAATDATQSLTVNAATATKDALAALVKIYPNPTSDFIRVELQNNTTVTGDIILSNMMGMEAARTKFSNNGNSTTAELSIANLPKGMYVLQIETNAGVVSQKIEKK